MRSCLQSNLGVYAIFANIKSKGLSGDRGFESLDGYAWWNQTTLVALGIWLVLDPLSAKQSVCDHEY